MICYRCGNKLGAGRRCLHCGADVTLYRKIVRTSNSYYNAGLDKAQLRDLTGAIECLETCLQYNKNHIEARNLLGLIYFEMGEIAEALSQWLISRHLQPQNNRCNEYLALLKKEQNMLDDMNQSVKKYNQALEQARIDSPDLAIITLKRVLKQQPHMIKAYQLLALLYINENDYSKANRLLKRALEIDKGNTLCQTYIRQIRGKLGSGGRRARKEQKSTWDSLQFKPKEKTVSRLVEGDEDESIVPTVKERSGLANTVVSFLSGLAVAMCLFQFVILPTVNRNATVAQNERVVAATSKLTDTQLQLQALQEQVDSEAEERATWQEQVASYTGEDGVITQYNRMLDIMEEYISDSRSNDTIVNLFKQINKDVVEDSTFQELYQMIYTEVIASRVSTQYNNGIDAIDMGDYSDARDYFEACLELNSDYDPAIYYLGVCYKNLGDTETANEYFADIVVNYRNSDYWDAAVDEVGENPASSETEEDGSGDGESSDEENSGEEDNSDDEEDEYSEEGDYSEDEE